MRKTIFTVLIFLFSLNNYYSQTAGCFVPSASALLDINNVRALIHNGGDMWWDLLGAAKYEIPKGSGKTSLFAGSLWIGGVDYNGQLHLAAQRFRQDGVEYWPSPLKESGINQGETSIESCIRYNKIFKITKKEVKDFKTWYNTPVNIRDSLYPNYIVPQSIINWPAMGDVSNNYSQYLAPFFDYNNDGDYNYLDGDYPYYDLDSTIDCNNGGFDVKRLFGDMSLWWVFNDNGNLHTETGGNALKIEIRAQAFAFASNDEDINNATFYSYDIINRSAFTYYNTYIGVWNDADLGKADDDYIGCDVSRGLGYLYNGDNEDGYNGAPTWAYGINPPAIGIDFFRGPLKDPNGKDDLSNWNNGTLDCNNGYKFDSVSQSMIIAGASDIMNGNINGQFFGDNIIDNERLGMQHFVKFSCGSGNGATDSPKSAIDYYNYMQGKWKDGSSLMYGGYGYGSLSVANVTAMFKYPGKSDICIGVQI